MPIYKYRCLECNYEFEYERGMMEVLEVKCLMCYSENTRQVITAPAIQFNCDGFYATDHGKYKTRWDEERKIKSEKEVKDNQD